MGNYSDPDEPAGSGKPAAKPPPNPVDGLFQSTDVRDRLPVAKTDYAAYKPGGAPTRTDYGAAYQAVGGARSNYAAAGGGGGLPRPAAAAGPRPQLPVAPAARFITYPMHEAGAAHDANNVQVEKGGKGVVYMSDDRAAKHLVTIGHVITRRGVRLDSRQLRDLFGEKRAAGSTPNTAGHSKLDNAEKTPELEREWKKAPLIWVCLEDDGVPMFYSGVPKLDHIHHSSYGYGGEVIGAGEWIVEDGALRKISANSGHYRPNLDSLVASVRLLAAAYRHDTVVLMYDGAGSIWVERPLLDFLYNPSGGGRYKVNNHA